MEVEVGGVEDESLATLDLPLSLRPLRKSTGASRANPT
jgi:hypothetical protein